MKQILQNLRNGEIFLEEVPPPTISGDGIIVRNHFSLISAGTEKTAVNSAQKNIFEKVKDDPSKINKVIDIIKREGLISAFKKVHKHFNNYQVLGYSTSGVVVESLSSRFLPGDRVACAGAGCASHAEQIFVPENLAVKVPDEVTLEDACFTTLGAIALQGVRRLAPEMGENIVVIGLGLLGLLTIQFLKANGCKVIGIDVDNKRCEIAENLGCKNVFTNTSLFEKKDEVLDITGGHGFDGVIITAGTSSNEPIETAGVLCRSNGRVVVVGNVGMDVPRNLYYEKELDLRVSRSYGPGRYDYNYETKGLDYPYNYVRWTENRNMQEFLNLVKSGHIDLKPLTTHIFKLDEAESAYDLLSGKKTEFYIGIILKYETEDKLQNSIKMSENFTVSDNANMGIIGSGNFFKAVFMPALKGFKDVSIIGVCSIKGLNAKECAKELSAGYCTSDSEEILKDEKINAVIISTRHDSHFELSKKAILSGKSVLIEKPPVINVDDLNELKTLMEKAESKYMVGYNRRFSPFAIKIREYLKDRTRPILINYRINAGYIPKENWIQDPLIGGGRIIGEVCHFIDLITYLTGSLPQSVTVFPLKPKIIDDYWSVNDSIIINLEMRDGSAAVIQYTSDGSSLYPKERIDITGNALNIYLDDFTKLTVYSNGKRETFRNNQDKGHKNELNYFINWCRGQVKQEMDFEEIYYTSLTTFKILESIKTNTTQYL